MGDDMVQYSMTGIRAQGTMISFQSSELGTVQHNRFQGTWYTEHQAFLSSRPN
jgi:hypothetical protein